jgi:hypothetical protein
MEVYAACRCLYYQHPVDRCSHYGKSGHAIKTRSIPVGYACSTHAEWSNSDSTRIHPKRKSRKQPRGPNHHIPVIAVPSPKVNEEGKKPVALPNRASDLRDTGSGVLSQAPTVIDETEKDSAEGTRFKNQDLSSTLTVDGQNVNWTEIWNINKTIPEYAESNDSDSIDTRSVGSQASTATTVDEDALDALFRGLLVHKGLHNLWPQIVDRQTSRGDAKRIIERFFRRFAEDLECLASKIKKESNGQKVNKHDIALSSSRFVRKYRASIASRIYEAHDIRSETLDVGIDIEEHSSLFKDDGADTDAETFVFSIAEEFIFDTEPIMYLEANVSAFVRQQQRNHFSLFATSLRMYTSIATQFLRQTPVPNGKRRLNWTCVSALIPLVC